MTRGLHEASSPNFNLTIVSGGGRLVATRQPLTRAGDPPNRYPGLAAGGRPGTGHDGGPRVIGATAGRAGWSSRPRPSSGFFPRFAVRAVSVSRYVFTRRLLANPRVGSQIRPYFFYTILLKKVVLLYWSTNMNAYILSNRIRVDLPRYNETTQSVRSLARSVPFLHIQGT